MDFSLTIDNRKGGCVGDQVRGIKEKNKILVFESSVTYVSSMVFIYFCSNSNIVKGLASPTVVCVQCLVSEVDFVL